ILAIWQALCFPVTEIQRVAKWLSNDNAGATAISFAVVMMATSFGWYFKSPPTSIQKKVAQWRK
ncbi:hypothetical protein PoMZ_07087, partial [Pyricularia oryzae]